MDETYVPLADRMRPTKLDQVIGQMHITASGKLLNKLAADKHPISLIFWGPPGSGKTTLARIIASETNADFIELSAVASGKKDVMAVIDKAKSNQLFKKATVLFVDEIHRFNKAQQDAFLPYVENGTIILIGATTENPSFEVIPALLSRCRVVVLNSLSEADVKTIIEQAARKLKVSQTKLPNKIIDLLASLSNGDGRYGLNLLELSLNLAGEKPVNRAIVMMAAQKQIPLHDKSGESHYNLISAFIKSLRGGNVSAAYYYMARLLQGGEDPKFIARRMIIFASEDIGLAAPAALNLAVSTFLAVERIGLPETEYNLYHCAAVLAKAPKSRQVAESMVKAKLAAEQYPNLNVPLHLRNAPTKLMKQLGYNKDYHWQAGYKPQQGFLPPELSDLDIFND